MRDFAVVLKNMTIDVLTISCTNYLVSLRRNNVGLWGLVAAATLPKQASGMAKCNCTVSGSVTVTCNSVL